MIEPQPLFPAEPLLPDAAPPPARLRFDEQVQRGAVSFARSILQAVPELEGIAIIPSYTIPQDSLPSAYVLGRNGPLSTAAEIARMTYQVVTAHRYLVDRARSIMTTIDNHMADRAQALKKLEEKIDERQRQLAAIVQEPESGSAE